MKNLSVLSFFALASTAWAGIAPPTVTVGVTAGGTAATGTLGGVEPRVKWNSGPVSVAGFDVEGGLSFTVKEVDEVPPTSFWAKVKKSIGDFASVEVKGDMSVPDSDIIGLNVQVDSMGTNLKFTGVADLGNNVVSLDNVEVTKSIEAGPGSLTVTPKYNLGSSTPNVALGYAMDKTALKVDVQKKTLAVSHSFSDDDTVSPTVSLNGDFSLKYSRNLPSGTIAASYKPDESVEIEWADSSGFVTTFSAPVNGLYGVQKGLQVSMKRDLTVNKLHRGETIELPRAPSRLAEAGCLIT